MRVVTIKLVGGGSYTAPLSEISDPLHADLEAAENGEALVFSFTLSEMSDTEYEALPDFEGH
jgi:hypothetical protein